MPRPGRLGTSSGCKRYAGPRARGHTHGPLWGPRPRAGPALARIIPAYFQAFTTLLVYYPPLRRTFGGLGPWRRFTQIATRVDQLLVDAITSRRRGGEERDDILSLLLAAGADEGRALTDAEVRDEVITLLLAGHETVAIALAWAFYWLHRQPDVLPRLQAELHALGHPPSPDALVHLPYLRAVCAEALRLYPVVGAITRRLRQPMTLRGYRLPAGTAVGAALPLIHLDPMRYPDPLHFRPERFLERTYTPYEFLPFGGGARRCVGAAFAVAEMAIVLGSLLAQHASSRPTISPPHLCRELGLGQGGGMALSVPGLRLEVYPPVQPILEGGSAGVALPVGAPMVQSPLLVISRCEERGRSISRS